MEKSKKISELLNTAGRLTGLEAKSRQRSKILAEVRAALPERLAQAVVSAGVEEGRLTIGVAGSVWAARIRYCAEATRIALNRKLETTVLTVRIRVVPPQAI
jgi:hypothetical protein